MEKVVILVSKKVIWILSIHMVLLYWKKFVLTYF